MSWTACTRAGITPASAAANCTDCHVPHSSILPYYVKAVSGFNHVRHFTFGSIPEPIRAKPATDEIIQENCIRCHSETVSAVADGQMDSGRYCFECHRDVAHGERGISILPHQDKGIYDPESLQLHEEN